MAITTDIHPLRPQHWQPAEVKIINDRAVKFRDVVVHTIRMGDVEDPDIMVAHHLWTWQESEQGKWIMETAMDQPYWHRSVDTNNFGYRYDIVARLSEQNETFWRLKWGGNN